MGIIEDGADSNNKRNNLPEPSKQKVEALIKELEKFTKVNQKSNLKRSPQNIQITTFYNAYTNFFPFYYFSKRALISSSDI